MSVASSLVLYNVLILAALTAVRSSHGRHAQRLFTGCSPLGSGTVQFKMAGEVLVKPHESVKTGYKAPNAYGAKPIFSDET